MPFWDTDYKKEMMKSKAAKEAAEQRAAEAKQKAAEYRQKVNAVIVTTGDLKEDYEIIGPVFFQVSNKGIFSSTLSELVNKYSAEIEEMKNNALMSERRTDWGFLWGEYSVGQNDFEKAFFEGQSILFIDFALLNKSFPTPNLEPFPSTITIFLFFHKFFNSSKNSSWSMLGKYSK